LKLDNLTLASASPRRRELIKALGVPFSIFTPMVDETLRSDKPEALVNLAIRKAQSCKGEGVVVSADTTVAIDGRFWGKPTDEKEALAMLLALRGREHLVITAIASLFQGRLASSCCITRVTMRRYNKSDAVTYIASGEAMDKAGAYAIQDSSFRPVASCAGCYLNVVGLPLCALVRDLKKLDFHLENLSLPEECQGCQIKDLPVPL